GGLGEGSHRATGEFAADLREEGLARVEGEVDSERVDGDALGSRGPEVHLDTGAGAMEEGDVLEGVEIEVAAELAIDHAEDVLVEGGREPLSVVVGPMEGRVVFHEIHAEHEHVPGTERRAQTTQEGDGFVGGEVADGSSEKEVETTFSSGDGAEVTI